MYQRLARLDQLFHVRAARIAAAVGPDGVRSEHAMVRQHLAAHACAAALVVHSRGVLDHPDGSVAQPSAVGAVTAAVRRDVAAEVEDRVVELGHFRVSEVSIRRIDAPRAVFPVRHSTGGSAVARLLKREASDIRVVLPDAGELGRQRRSCSRCDLLDVAAHVVRSAERLVERAHPHHRRRPGDACRGVVIHRVRVRPRTFRRRL